MNGSIRLLFLLCGGWVSLFLIKLILGRKRLATKLNCKSILSHPQNGSDRRAESQVQI